MKTTTFLIASVLIGWVNVKLINLPNANLIYWAMLAVAIDFVTGVLKNKIAKQQTVNSQGFRKTGLKLLQYLGLIIGGIILNNTSEKLDWLSDGLIIFIIYTEVYSIFENLYELDKKSKVAPFYKWAIRMLSLNIEKLTPKEGEEKKSDVTNTTLVVMIVTGSILLLSQSCTIVRPGVNEKHEKTEETNIAYKPIYKKDTGATVTNTVNYDSLFKAWKQSLPEQEKSKADSLFKAFLKTFKKDTVRIIDPTNRTELKYWHDQYGNLQMSCQTKDKTIEFFVAEVTKLQKQLDSSNTTVVKYKMIWWGWMICGYAAFITIILALAIIFKNRLF